MTEATVNEALGKLAGILVEKGAKVGLNEVRAVLRELDRDAYSTGYADAEAALDGRDNEADERAYAAETARECGG